MNNGKKTPKELMREYFQENSVEEVKNLLSELNEKYKGSITIKEFKEMYSNNESKKISKVKLKKIDNIVWEESEYHKNRGEFEIELKLDSIIFRIEYKFEQYYLDITGYEYDYHGSTFAHMKLLTFDTLKQAKTRAYRIAELLEELPKSNK